MTPFDPRNCFYLEHRARIEEWTTLEQPARAACDAWLASLEPRFRELAHENGPGQRTRTPGEPASTTFHLAVLSNVESPS